MEEGCAYLAAIGTHGDLVSVMDLIDGGNGLADGGDHLGDDA